MAQKRSRRIQAGANKAPLQLVKTPSPVGDAVAEAIKPPFKPVASLNLVLMEDGRIAIQTDQPVHVQVGDDLHEVTPTEALAVTFGRFQLIAAQRDGLGRMLELLTRMKDLNLI